MKITILLIIAILLSGCGNGTPIDNIEDDDFLFKEHQSLLVRFDNLLFEIDRLKKANEELSEHRDKCNELINSYANLQTKYAILESYYNNLKEQYNTLLPQIGSQYVEKDKTLQELTEQYHELEKRQLLITNQIALVRSKNVPLLSANLTDIEYNAFYKGWELWWWTFNEKDEEDD